MTNRNDSNSTRPATLTDAEGRLIERVMETILRQLNEKRYARVETASRDWWVDARYREEGELVLFSCYEGDRWMGEPPVVARYNATWTEQARRRV